MKKVLFSLFLFSALAVGVQAQSSSCAKSCAAKPAGAACESKSADASAAAAKLAATDATIETKTCPGTTAVCYVRKVSEQNGTVSYVDVTYDATTNTFVNVSPVKASGKEAGCSGKSASGAKACCAPGASKTKTASSTTSSNGTTTAPSKG
ncbi:MAG TPA: hypothetical protein VGK46_01700 [Saprospiraceae bacterium]|jgi:hypothetical protein